MLPLDQISMPESGIARSTIRSEATRPASHRGYDAMARRRFQKPTPFKEGQYWWLLIWDSSETGSRKRQRIKLADADMPFREVQKVADEKLWPMNQGLELKGSAMKLGDFMAATYVPTYLSLLSKSTQDSYRAHISKYLKPRFGDMRLRDLPQEKLQEYFSGMAGKQSYPTISKIRDVLSSILRSAVHVRYLTMKSMGGIRLPLDKRPRRRKPTLTRAQFTN